MQSVPGSRLYMLFSFQSVYIINTPRIIDCIFFFSQLIKRKLKKKNIKIWHLFEMDRSLVGKKKKSEHIVYYKKQGHDIQRR